VTQDIAKRAREGVEAFNRGDIAEALEGFSPEIVWEVGSDLVPDAGVYEGHDGVRRFWGEWQELFEGFEIEILECRAVDERHVFSVIRAKGVGAGSGMPVVSPEFFQIFEFDEGEVVRIRLSANREVALGEG
jgi:ketosteroid isomerase-like protein